KHVNVRFLPDKAIDVIDEAGAALRVQPAGRQKKTVRTRDVEHVVATMAKIPPRTVSVSDRDRLLTLDRDIKLLVFGQDHAVDTVVSAIRLARAGLGQPEKPVGSFLFAGPTGVGKTEVAKQLAAALGFGDPSNKDKGKKVLERLFAPEFRNRLDAVVEFGALTPEAVERVVDKFITELDAQLLARRVTVQLTPGARRWLAERGYDQTFGARPMARLIQTEIKRVLADEMLFGQLREGGRVEIDAGPDGLVFRYAPLKAPAAPAEPARASARA